MWPDEDDSPKPYPAWAEHWRQLEDEGDDDVDI